MDNLRDEQVRGSGVPLDMSQKAAKFRTVSGKMHKRRLGHARSATSIFYPCELNQIKLIAGASCKYTNFPRNNPAILFGFCSVVATGKEILTELSTLWDNFTRPRPIWTGRQRHEFGCFLAKGPDQDISVILL